MTKEKFIEILQVVGALCEIFGVTVIGFIDPFLFELPQILIIAGGISLILSAIIFIVSKMKFREQLSNKDNDLLEKDEIIRELNEKIRELNEQINVLRKILITKTPNQAGYYMTNKEEYDKFKTDLEILKCNLDVGLVKDSEDGKDYHLQFKWKLEVLNPSENKSVEKAKFIYSGDKGDYSSPNVTFDQKSAKVTMKPEKNKNAVGDDRFIEIVFPSALRPKSTAEICIDYTLHKYMFKPQYDRIWLVPDALGFASMNKFCIRFFSDGKIVKNTTFVVLRSYKLSGEYEEEDDQVIPFEQLGEGKEGFAYENKDGYEALKGHGFLLILINDKEDLPDYLENIPAQNN